MEKVRTRFAPSPTGYMHVGNLRTALYEYLLARHYEGTFILRVEDTDQERQVDGALDFIFNTLKLCNMSFDEGPNIGGSYGPYFQSERLPLYKKYAEELVLSDKAYYCFCSEERLEILRKEAEENKVAFMYDGHCLKLSKEEIAAKIANNEPYVIRQKMPKYGTTSYEDLVYGKMTFENKLLEDQILIKSDGYPTYNFANVVDDHLMDITHVVRGNEYLSSTPKYQLLYEAFGWKSPEYVHLPVVVNDEGKKLSKRNNDASFMDLYERGFLPEAIVNYLALLGWSPETNDEIFSMDELIKNFNVKRINKSPAIYDIKKLEWVNSHYIKKMTIDDLINITKPHLVKEYDLTDKDESFIKELVTLYQNELSYGAQIVELSRLFFKHDINYDEECLSLLKEEGVSRTLNVFCEEIKNISDWSIDNIKQAIDNTKQKAEVKGKMLFMPIRVKTTGQMHGPELPNTLHLLGKEKVLKSLES